MSTLVLAEHGNGVLSPLTGALVTAAGAIGAPVTVLVAGVDCQAVARAASLIDGVAKVLVADHALFAENLAEPVAELLADMARGYRIVMAATSTTGKDVLPRAAALCGAPQISDVIAVDASDRFLRSAYAGNALELVRTEVELTFLTVRVSSFALAGQGGNAPVMAVDFVPAPPVARLVSRAQSQNDRPDLGAAQIVVSGGRAFGSRERFEAVLGPLADKLNAAIGASRAAVDAGYVANDLQVGQTGRIVAPHLYIACGISGAVQHIAGMKGSKVIVAINSDPEAPIFDYADYGLVADIFAAVPELTAKL